ncbi:hypothetical protein [Streptomyces sp. NPDC029004]|uniref:hypothetical protein n=1 Tax=Streptomyces sp. NPDC029004 TaxID=3154490 RepID=UPI0033DE6375
MDLAAQAGAGEVVAGEDGAYGAAEFFQALQLTQHILKADTCLVLVPAPRRADPHRAISGEKQP